MQLVYFDSSAEVLVDLLRLDMGARDQRILLAAERRIGDAVVFLAGGKRRWRQLHGRAQPQPHGADRERHQREQCERWTGLVSTECAGHTCRLSPHRTGCQGQPSAAEGCTHPLFTKPSPMLDKRPDLGSSQRRRSWGAAIPTQSAGLETTYPIPAVRGPTSSAPVMSHRSRSVAAGLLTAAWLFSVPPRSPRTTTRSPRKKPPLPARSPPRKRRRSTTIAEALRVLGAPAGNPECVWLGRRVVSLLWRDDLDTAFRHLDLYDRFGCPSGHIQATFRCLVLHGSNIDPKAADTLERARPGLLDQPGGAALPPRRPRAAAPSPTDERRLVADA